MKWRKVDEFPVGGSMVWVMLEPHKETVASLELHCGWADYYKGNDWYVNNCDETGDGAVCWYLPGAIGLMGDGRSIIAWLPAEEFVYPDWVRVSVEKKNEH